MPRKVKTPEDRKKDFIETAEMLFRSNGYERTAVDDIVAKMGVAKGLFYYYFDSKEDVLALIVDRMVEESVAMVEGTASRTDLDTMGKFREFLKMSAAMKLRSRRITLFVHKESNRHLHSDIESRVVRLMAPAIAKMIRQGVEERVFDTKYPDEAALSFFAVSSALGHDVYQHLDPELFQRRVEAALDIIERILGAAPGTFGFYKEQVPKGPRLKKWIRQLRNEGGLNGGRSRGKSDR